LISAEPLEELDNPETYIEKIKLFDFKIMDDIYIVCARPYLQKFLDFLFKNFKVNIWTAASKSYALFVINEFILKKNPKRQLHCILFDTHCKLSKKKYSNAKKLEMVWNKFKDMNESNTYIIDDLEEICNGQQNNCFNISPFLFLEKDSESDTELLNLIKTMKNKFNII
jgi:TFIIF-interacting CTD phosphatase-like protein